MAPAIEIRQITVRQHRQFLNRCGNVPLLDTKALIWSPIASILVNVMEPGGTTVAPDARMLASAAESSALESGPLHPATDA
ncbi:MAG: hypothetical protein AB7U20_22450, partial [Planctomycetaceae bacterium]